MSTTVPVNNITLVGRLTRDPQLRHSANGQDICEMRVAVNGSGNRPATFVDVVTFGKAAKACASYLPKGREVAVTGQLSYREWLAADGSRRSKHSVIGRVRFGSRGAPAAA